MDYINALDYINAHGLGIAKLVNQLRLLKEKININEKTHY